MLRTELGLGDDDEVHRITITGGDSEILTPSEVTVPPGAWVEFVTDDWRVHEVRFELDSLDAERRAFLMDGDQVASPPLLERGARFVLSFEDAPSGRYPFIAEGNTAPSRGVVVVRPKP